MPLSRRQGVGGETRAVEAFGRLAPKGHSPSISQALACVKDSSIQVKLVAVRVLSRVAGKDDSNATAALRKLLGSNDDALRIASLSALGHLGFVIENVRRAAPRTQKSQDFKLRQVFHYLVRAGYNAYDLKLGGLTLYEMVKARVIVQDLMKAGYTLPELHRAGCSNLESLWNACQANGARAKCVELARAGYTIQWFREAGYTLEEMMQYFLMLDLHVAGYTWGQLATATNNRDNRAHSGYERNLDLMWHGGSF